MEKMCPRVKMGMGRRQFLGEEKRLKRECDSKENNYSLGRKWG
jgi:hypothetical protein